MARMNAFEIEGAVVEALPHATYCVVLANGHRVLAHWKGKNRIGPECFALGEKVMLEMSPFDLSQGRIRGNEKQI